MARKPDDRRYAELPRRKKVRFTSPSLPPPAATVDEACGIPPVTADDLEITYPPLTGPIDLRPPVHTDVFHYSPLTGHTISNYACLTTAQILAKPPVKAEMTAQLHFYDITFNRRMPAADLAATLHKAIEDGKCNKIPASTKKTWAMLEKIWELDNKKHLQKLSDKRMEQWKAEKTDERKVAMHVEYWVEEFVADGREAVVMKGVEKDVLDSVARKGEDMGLWIGMAGEALIVATNQEKGKVAYAAWVKKQHVPEKATKMTAKEFLFRKRKAHSAYLTGGPPKPLVQQQRPELRQTIEGRWMIQFHRAAELCKGHVGMMEMTFRWDRKWGAWVAEFEFGVFEGMLVLSRDADAVEDEESSDDDSVREYGMAVGNDEELEIRADGENIDGLSEKEARETEDMVADERSGDSSRKTSLEAPRDGAADRPNTNPPARSTRSSRRQVLKPQRTSRPPKNRPQKPASVSGNITSYRHLNTKKPHPSPHSPLDTSSTAPHIPRYVYPVPRPSRRATAIPLNSPIPYFWRARYTSTLRLVPDLDSRNMGHMLFTSPTIMSAGVIAPAALGEVDEQNQSLSWGFNGHKFADLAKAEAEEAEEDTRPPKVLGFVGELRKDGMGCGKRKRWVDYHPGLLEKENKRMELLKELERSATRLGVRDGDRLLGPG